MHSIRAYKKYIPQNVWNGVRRLWLMGVNLTRVITPRKRTLDYCDFRVHYLRGNSLVARLAAEPVFEEGMCKKIVHDMEGKVEPVFMDVGANIGLVSMYVLRHVPKVKVFAFEPGPTQATLLEETIATNGLEAVCTLSTSALSNTSGTTTFYVHPNRDYAKDGLQDTGRGERTKTITVQTQTLDEWWVHNGRPAVHVVKIDTEGAELLILRGAREFINTIKPVLYLEIAMSNLKAYPYTALDIHRYLTEIGYSLETLYGKVVLPHDLETLLRVEDTFRAHPTVPPQQ